MALLMCTDFKAYYYYCCCCCCHVTGLDWWGPTPLAISARFCCMLYTNLVVGPWDDETWQLSVVCFWLGLVPIWKQPITIDHLSQVAGIQNTIYTEPAKIVFRIKSLWWDQNWVG
jgi:hypothetical protein